MRFRNNSQRKAVMAKLRNMGFSDTSAKFYAQKGINPDEIRNENFKQLAKKGIYLKYQEDKDKDGVKNVNDCKPLNSSKQGVLHDWQMKRLKKQEEQYESRREAQQKKLEDLKDELVQRKKVFDTKTGARQAELAQKQAVINEINTEKEKLKGIEKAEAQASKEMDKYTVTGRAKTKIKATGAEIKRRWNSEESKKNRAVAAKGAGKALKKIWKAIK